MNKEEVLYQLRYRINWQGNLNDSMTTDEAIGLIDKALDKYTRQESIAFAEWIATYKTDSGDKIILCDGNYYWESDEEGSHPLDGKDLNTLYQQSK